MVLEPFLLLLRHRSVLLRTTLVELRTVYAASVLGLLWVVIGPAILLSLYAVVYTCVFQVRPVNLTVQDYILNVFSGLVPLIAFAMSLSAGASSLTKNRQLLLNTVFPSELLPIRSVLVASAILPVGLFLIVCARCFLGGCSWTILLVPVVIVLQTLFLCGVSSFLSLLTLAVRDIEQLLQYVAIILMTITPIAYTPDMITGRLKMLIYVNPLYYFVTCYQHLIIYKTLPPTFEMGMVVVMSLGAFIFGQRLFRRMKLLFFDFA